MEREGDMYSCIYPLTSLGQGKDKVILELVRYATFAEAKSKWDNRKKWINRDNIFVKILIPNNDKNSLERFDQLPYKNKVCFCPKNVI